MDELSTSSEGQTFRVSLTLFRPSRLQVAIGFGVAALLLILVNIGLFVANLSLQTDIAGRQDYLTESAGLSRLNEGLVKALAAAAFTTNDPAIRKMLRDQGIEYSLTQTQPK